MTIASILSALAKHAHSTPDRTAVTYSVNEARNLSYYQLACLVNIYRKKIKSLNIPSNDKAVICLENSAEYIALLYACWSLDITVIPLHSQSAVREVQHILDFSQAKLAITKNNLAINLENSVQHLKVEANEFELLLDTEAAKPDLDQWVIPAVEHNALILFTSGTTGDPKGVMLSHSNLLANTQSIVQYLSLSATDCTYCVLPFTYSYGNSVLQTHIYAGASICLGQSMLYPKLIAEDLNKASITGFSGVPSTFQILLHKTSFAKIHPQLRYITQAGGSMSVTTTKELLEALPNTDIYVMYGQTEASARLTYLPPARLLEKAGSIGIPIPDVELAISDESGKLLGPNETGELIAKGDNIMQGYLSNPTATEQTITGDWLHTGDLGYRDIDGFYYIKGRQKQMIKSGANRIHPEEIEEVILECDAVSEVSVTGIKDELLGEVIAAFVILKQ
ncbi:hypothetical protein A3752_02055, partial [Oleiphilus sp. HI0081]